MRRRPRQFARGLVNPEYSQLAGSLAGSHQESTGGIDRKPPGRRFRGGLPYRRQPTGPLVDNLAMICPFGASEKQALLECGDVVERSRIVTALVEMAVLQRAGGHDQDDDDGPAVVH